MLPRRSLPVGFFNGSSAQQAVSQAQVELKAALEEKKFEISNLQSVLAEQTKAGHLCSQWNAQAMLQILSRSSRR